MDDMTAQNMAKGLNVYVTGPTGAAMRAVGMKLVSGGMVTASAAGGEMKALPPLKLKRVTTGK